MRTEDGCIIHRCLNGEPGVFGLLVDKYKAGIYAYVYTRLPDFQDAQDVTQEVFLQAYRDLRTLRRYESFVFWLYRIAYNCCAKYLQARSRRPDRESIEDQDPRAIEDSFLNSYRDSQLNESLWETIYSLPETYQQVLMLYYFGGMNSNEIAKALGTSPTAIRMRLSRARAQLKAEMIAMMNTDFDGQRLQASFTFRIVEAVKRMKISPMPRMAGLPWGLSLAAGIIITVLSLNPHVSITNDISIPTGSPLPVETRALKAGEIPVDIMEVSDVPFIANRQADSNGGELKPPDRQNAAVMAAPGAANTWTEGTDLPAARTRVSTCVVDGVIYAIGGLGEVANLSTVEAYDPVEDEWETKASMPTARQWPGASVVDGIIYVIGGSPAFNTSTDKVEAYDPVEDEWETKKEMPTHREGVTTSVVDGIIYAIGGFQNGSGVGLPTVEAYDPANDKWEQKADMPVGICFHTASVVDGKIYVIGGQEAGGDWGDPCRETVLVYDPASDTWEEMNGTMLSPRADHSATVVDGIIYTFGGCSLPPGSQDGIDIVEAYNPATDTWEKKAKMPTARMCLSTSAIGGEIYAIGGEASYLGVRLPTVEVYDTGFVPPAQGSSVGPKGKILSTWGETKSH